MKNLKTTVYAFGSLIILAGGSLALMIDYFGWHNVQIFVWALSLSGAYALGRYHTGRDMVTGAKLALVSQESDDRRDQATMGAIGQLIRAVKNPALQQATLPPGSREMTLPDADLEFEEADFMMIGDSED